MKPTDVYVLSNGLEIPKLGFGTWQSPEGEIAESAVLKALEVGYIHVDTAAVYRNEPSVGRAVKRSGIPREKLFITSKLWNTERGYEKAMKAFEVTLEKLQMDYLDMYLLHWPANPNQFENWKELNAGSWRALEELYETKRVRAIGISNFKPYHIDALLETAKIKPMVNQIQIYPGQIPQETIDYCKEKGIQLEAYSPLGTGEIVNHPLLKEIGAQYGKSPAQVAIRWSLENGFLPLPKSVTPARIEENFDIFDFELTKEDHKKIATMKAESEPVDSDAIDF